ncbi:MAG: aminotransferase class I/II-fold pyridoxal phosphate-dependent enzyme [Christensenellaceae bacterium]
MKTPILDMLSSIAKGAGVRFCMPGHKGKGVLFGGVHKYDITELPSADNLHMPSGVIRQSQDLHAGFIGAKQSFYSVNGSTACVQAAVLSALSPNDKILAARDIHISAISAFALSGAQVEFIHPSHYHDSLPSVITPADVSRAISLHPDATALYVTYPNYYGLCMDIAEVCRIAHSSGLTVICDGAHSATFDFSDLLPLSCAYAGCDLFTASLHKTLPAMNQCATLSVGTGTNIKSSIVKERLNMLQTTSPSYLLLASADYALSYMREYGKSGIARVISLVEETMKKIEALGGYRCATQDIEKATGAYDRDILRLVVDVTDRGISGIGAARYLAKQSVYVEAADAKHILLICTISDDAEDYAALLSALSGIRGADYSVEEHNRPLIDYRIFEKQPQIPIRDAVFSKKRYVPFEESAGQISAASVGAYPPGVPLLVPGQQITNEMIDHICELRQHGYSLFGEQGGFAVADI